MKREIARKWVKALKSGDYVQGQGRLRSSTNEFCCLGVLCNLHAQEFPELAATQKTKSRYFGSSGYLPDIVQEWAGIADRDVFFDCESVPPLVEMNDKLGYSFDKIANVISKNYKSL